MTNRKIFGGSEIVDAKEKDVSNVLADTHVFVDVATNEPVVEDGTKNAGCRLPNLDPFDPRVMKFVYQVKNDMNCQSAPKAATRLDKERRLTVNEDVVQEDAISKIRYRFIKRPPGNLSTTYSTYCLLVRCVLSYLP